MGFKITWKQYVKCLRSEYPQEEQRINREVFRTARSSMRITTLVSCLAVEDKTFSDWKCLTLFILGLNTGQCVPQNMSVCRLLNKISATTDKFLSCISVFWGCLSLSHNVIMIDSFAKFLERFGRAIAFYMTVSPWPVFTGWFPRICCDCRKTRDLRSEKKTKPVQAEKKHRLVGWAQQRWDNMHILWHPLDINLQQLTTPTPG